MNCPLTVWLNCKAATLQAGAAQPYGLIEDAALVVSDGSLQWVGPRSDLPANLLNYLLLNDTAIWYNDWHREGKLLIDTHRHLFQQVNVGSGYF